MSAPGQVRWETSIVAGGQLVQQVLTLVTGVMIARILGSESYGVVNLVRTIFALLLILAPLGLDLALMRQFGRQSPLDAGAGGLLARLRLVSFVVNLAVAALIGFGLSGFLERELFRYDGFSRLLTITLFALPAAADLAILGACYRALERPGSYALMTVYLQSILRLVLVLAVAVLIPTIDAVVWINTVQVLASAGLVFWHFTRLRGGVVPSGVVPPALPSWSEVRALLRTSLSMALNLVAYGTMRFVDILMLGVLGSARDAGEYAALSTVSQLVQIFPMAASQSLGPRIARHYQAGDLASMHREFNQYIRFASIAASFVFAGIAAFGDRLDLVFGPSFHFRADVAFLVPLGFLLSAMLAPMGFALSMTGRHWAELAILLLGLLIMVGLCAFLIPTHGQMGAAIAVATAFGVVNIVRFAVVAKVLGFIPGRLADFLPPVAALGVAFAMREVALAYGERTFVMTLLACMAYAALYGLVALLFLADASMRSAILARLRRSRNP